MSVKRGGTSSRQRFVPIENNSGIPLFALFRGGMDDHESRDTLRGSGLSVPRYQEVFRVMAEPEILERFKGATFPVAGGRIQRRDNPYYGLYCDDGFRYQIYTFDARGNLTIPTPRNGMAYPAYFLEPLDKLVDVWPGHGNRIVYVFMNGDVVGEARFGLTASTRGREYWRSTVLLGIDNPSERKQQPNLAQRILNTAVGFFSHR